MNDHNKPMVQLPGPTETAFSELKTEPILLSDNELNTDVAESSEQTIRRVLSSYSIGAKIRQLRLRKKIALVDLGKHTGLSASMLSQLENGRLVPTLATLARIAMVFDVGLDHFFSDKKRKRPFLVVRSEDRLQFPDSPTKARPDYMFECLAFTSPDKTLQAYLAEFPKRLPSEVSEHSHEGAEFIHMLDGSLAIHYSGEEHVLEVGDSVYFDSGEPHSYRGTSRQPAKALVVTTTPRL